MPRRHLTNDERAIRRSRGIAVWRFLPFMLMIIAIFIMSSDDHQLETDMTLRVDHKRHARRLVTPVGNSALTVLLRDEVELAMAEIEVDIKGAKNVRCQRSVDAFYIVACDDEFSLI